MRRATTLRWLVAGAAVWASIAVAGVAQAGERGNDVVEASREILGQTAPPQAPDHELYLQRVTVPAGAQLAPHTHPGTQVAHIEQGTLTYTLISGSAIVIRDGESEEVTAPATIKLRKGDGIVENAELVHEAANRGKKKIIIVLTALLTAGAPLSEPAPAT